MTMAEVLTQARCEPVRPLPALRLDPETGCWLWLHAHNSRGYGQVRCKDGRNHLVHRVFFERAFGLIPSGKQIDHLCRTPLCVNPLHLEAVTPGENVARGIKGILTTHCPRGHPYDESNTYLIKTRIRGRQCRTCHRLYEARRRCARTGHRWDESRCIRCNALACSRCHGEGIVYASYRARVAEDGEDCWECDGTGVAG